MRMVVGFVDGATGRNAGRPASRLVGEQAGPGAEIRTKKQACDRRSISFNFVSTLGESISSLLTKSSCPHQPVQSASL